MEFLGHIFASIALAITSFFGMGPQFGTSLTTILGTDQLSTSRVTINDNFTALNNGKIEVGTTSVASITTLANLATVGTITSGIWQGTAIDVARQGTGTTSPTSNQIMFGDGASGFKVIGFGNNGQALVSGGAGVAPSWSSVSVDQTQNYNWSGNHNFTGNTTVKNLSASSTSANPLTLNGVSFNTPSTQGASSTVLVNDGSGNLKWQGPVGTTTVSTGTITEIATSTGGNYDTTITLGYQPSMIVMTYFIQGRDRTAGSTLYCGEKAIATYVGSTLVSVVPIFTSTSAVCASGGITSDDGTPSGLTSFVNTTNLGSISTLGSNQSGGAQTTIGVSSISSTGFTIRCTVTTVTSPSTSRCKASWTAYR